MLGAIVGDIVGSAHKRNKTQDLDLLTPASGWTENTILLLASADCVLYGGRYETCYRRWFRWYPSVKGGYSRGFSEWASDAQPQPYYSCRSDGALRVIPVAYAFDTLKEVMEEAERAAAISHNHPEAIKGAQAVAAAVFLARTGVPKSTMSELLSNISGYDLTASYRELQLGYQYSELAQDTVPAAVVAFLSSSDVEDAIRRAIALGGDANTLAAISGGIAGAFYRRMPQALRDPAWQMLDEAQQEMIEAFRAEFMTSPRRYIAA